MDPAYIYRGRPCLVILSSEMHIPASKRHVHCWAHWFDLILHMLVFTGKQTQCHFSHGAHKADSPPPEGWLMSPSSCNLPHSYRSPYFTHCLLHTLSCWLSFLLAEHTWPADTTVISQFLEEMLLCDRASDNGDTAGDKTVTRETTCPLPPVHINSNLTVTSIGRYAILSKVHAGY